MRTVKFKSKLEVTNSDPPWHVVRVPKEKVASFGFKGNLRRVICTLNGSETFNCSLFPSKGNYFITLNRTLRDRLAVDIGDPVMVELAADESKYGMPMPDEFAEVMRQDPEGAKLFDALSPGNQKLLLKMIVLVKDVDKRIVRGLVALESLKECDGKFEYHILNDAMRRAMNLEQR